MDNIKETSYGYEISWAATENYSGKILVFNRPVKTDLSFHQQTQKTWFINSGDFRIRWIDTADGKLYEKHVKEGGVFHIEPLTPVSIESLTSDGSIAEVATPEIDDDNYCVIPATNIGD
jgi:hypothetical protein